MDYETERDRIWEKINSFKEAYRAMNGSLGNPEDILDSEEEKINDPEAFVSIYNIYVIGSDCFERLYDGREEEMSDPEKRVLKVRDRLTEILVKQLK